MYVWRLWGNVWEVGDAGDYFAYKFAVTITFILLLAAISAAWLVLWGTYRLAKLAVQRPLVGVPAFLAWLAFAGYVTYSVLNPPRGVAMQMSTGGTNLQAATSTTFAEAQILSASASVSSSAATVSERTTDAAATMRASALAPSAAAKALVVANTGGAGVNLRTAPQLADNVITGLLDGTLLTPTGRTANAGGINWVEVRDPRGEVGWLSGEYAAPSAASAGPAANDPASAVSAFYAALSAHNLQAAWNLYSPRYRATWDYANWVKAYANTRSVATSAVTVTAQSTSAATVQLTITAVDDDGGKMVTKVYKGTWQLVRAAAGWQLDGANIQQVA